jgi:uncharacterized protein
VKKIDLLRDLQESDSALDQVRRDLEECRTRLGDDSELVPLREEMEAARQQLKTLQSNGKDLDFEIESRNAKRKADEKKLYDGSIKNPKELGSLSHEVEMEKQQIGILEDKSLLNMEALEAASSAETAAASLLAAKEQEWRTEQASLETRYASLVAKESDLSARRQQTASQVDDATLRNYDRTRRMRDGIAVVPIERGACQGCRVSLSSIVVQRARSSNEPVTCQSCGRILYLP